MFIEFITYHLEQRQFSCGIWRVEHQGDGIMTGDSGGDT